MNKYKKYYCTSKDRLVTQELFSVYFNKALTVAKTKIESDEDMYRFYKTNKYHSHQTHKNTFTDKIYFISRRIMNYFKYKILISNKPVKALLDYGCGNGDFLKYISKKGIKVTGVEKSNNAKKICRSKGLKVFSTIKEFRDKKFDVITLWHVLEHVFSPPNTISSLARILSDGGILIIAIPNIQSIDSQVFRSEWAGLDVPRHIWHFTPKGLIDLLSKQGFIMSKRLPLILDAYYISLLSAKRKKLFFPWGISILVGTISNLIAIYTKNYSSSVFVFRKA